MELETIIKKLEAVEAAEPKPFLATRVKAELQKNYASPKWTITGKLIPWAVAAVLVFNIFTIWNNDADTTTITDTEESIVSLDDQFFINQFDQQEK